MTWFVLDLPRPPSVNRFNSKRGNASPVVLNWIAQADKHVLLQKPYPHFKCAVEIEVTWARPLKRAHRRLDIDNAVKPLLDYLQRIRLIENDAHCEEMHVSFGVAPKGCRVAIRPWVAA